jgi:hypothetical protein
VVTNLVHSGKYAGYYYITSNPTAGWVRDYWSVDWGSWGSRPTTKDFIVNAWVYVPTVNMTGPVSFITVGFDGYNPITVDIDRQTLPHRYLKLWNSIFTTTDGYQTVSPMVEFPFDKWVDLQLEVHLRPSTELSNVILYQDGVKIIDFKSYSLSAQAPTLLNMHFGLYAGNGQGAFAVYNDDLQMFDLSASTTSTSSTTTSSTTSTSSTTTGTSTQTIGTGVNYDNYINGYARAFQFTASASGTVSKVGLNVRTASGNVITAIYDDSSNSPNNLLGASASTAAASGWNDLALTTPVYITSGSKYWLACQISASALYVYDDYGTNTYYKRSWTYGSFPSPFGGSASPNLTINMRITYAQTTTGTTTTMSVSYSIVGGGTPTAPVFNYVLNGAAKSLTLSQASTSVSVDPGTTWSITANPLSSSSSTQRWYSNEPLTGTASSVTLVFSFYRQFYLTMQVSSSAAGSVAPGSGWYNVGQTVTINPTAKTGHGFQSWTGTGTGSYTGTSVSATITMNSAITETAKFS